MIAPWLLPSFTVLVPTFVCQVLSRSRHAEKRAPSIQVEAIELSSVVAQNPTLVLFANAFEVMRDFFSRVGPEGRAVGKVRRPEQVADADLVSVGHTKAIIDKGGIQLAAEVLARPHR